MLGAMMLFDSPLPGGHIPISSIAAIAVVIMLFIFIVVRSIINVHKEQVTTGIQGLLGETGVVLKDFTGKGKILIHGEIWNAISDLEIHKDEEVVIQEIKGMDLIVKKK